MGKHDAEYINKIQFENTPENRETLAQLIVGYWDMKDLVSFAEARLMDTWDPKMAHDADLYWTEDVATHRERLEDMHDEDV